MADWLKNQLTHFQNLETEQVVTLDIILETIFKYAGIRVPPEAISRRGRAIYLKVKPIEKNEIILKQKLILRGWRESLGKKAPDRII